MSENGKLTIREAREADAARQAAVDAVHAKQVDALGGKSSGFALALQEFDRSEEARPFDDSPTQFRAGEVKRTTNGCKACDMLGWQLDNDKAVLLQGPEAERYRALQTAAQSAHEATRSAQTAGAALRDAFAAFCAGAAPNKEP